MYDQTDGLRAISHQVAIAEETILRALQAGIRRQSGSLRLFPAQANILKLLRGRRDGLRLAEIAAQLGVSPASTSDSVSSLVEKHLVRRSAAPDDGRAVAIRLTSEGEKAVESLSEGPNVLSEAVSGLSETEQSVLLRALMKLIRSLELQNRVAETPICASCRYFRPFINQNAALTHQCGHFNLDFGDLGLRFECEGYRRASNELAAATWARFSTHGEEPEPIQPYLEDDF